MDLNLKGKVAAVAGASRGIGAAVARALAEEGCKVAICGRNGGKLNETAKRMREETRGTIVPIVADVAKKDSAYQFVRAAVHQFGGLDILVTNAGGPPPGNMADISDDSWTSAFNTTVLSTVRMSREAVPHLRRSPCGRIIHLTSSTTRQPIEGLILSNSLRLAVIGFSKHLALELAKDKITVNCVCQGWTDTERVQEVLAGRAEREKTDKAAALRAITSQIALGRLATPEEIGDLVAFLASDRASYITGSAIAIDGGYVKAVL